MTQCVSAPHSLQDGTVRLSDAADLGIKVATSVGTIIGQLVFGWLADVIGRKRIYGSEARLLCFAQCMLITVQLLIIIIGCLVQSMAGEGFKIPGHSPAVSTVGVIMFWRFIVRAGFEL